ncbi:hypothetical protein [Chimaeribacter arupi]|uniref:hypothetical protein n=1 Tax=Chimaeribacter arupi TaxID=2060066 RepID=UPI002948625E|nr:hypothetical protein [Chimaeribacter arupi]MDV5139672.1 hypothetical protein [Chimaeribacter arupi]
MNALLAQLSQRQIYCLPFGRQLIVYGQWQHLDEADHQRLQREKNQLATADSAVTVLPLPCWLNSMVLSEALSGDETQFGLFYLAPAPVEPEPARLQQLLSGLYQTFPLLNSAVAWGDDGPELHLFTSPYEGAPEYADATHYSGITRYSDADAFIRAQLLHPHSVFERGMLRVVCARCGDRMRWGIWLHHLVADADFVQVLLARVQGWLETGTWPEPDLHFIQQIWTLEQQLAAHHDRLRAFWREQAPTFSTRVAPPARALVPESPAVRFTLPDSPDLFTRVTLSLARALSALALPGPHLAVTPVTLRRVGQQVSSGCYINLLPVLLDEQYEAEAFNRLRLSWLEHALLPQEEITALCGLNYRDAIVMINLIDTALDTAGFEHRPEFRSRKPITLTLSRGEAGQRQVTLTTRWGDAFSRALQHALREALVR